MTRRASTRAVVAALLLTLAGGLVSADDRAAPLDIDYGELADYWVVVEQCVPKYPRKAKRAGMPGDVTVTVTIDASGRVTDVVVLDATPPDVFDDATVRCLTTWRFEPAPGVSAVAVRTTFNVPFRPR